MAGCRGGPNLERKLTCVSGPSAEINTQKHSLFDSLLLSFGEMIL